MVESRRDYIEEGKDEEEKKSYQEILPLVMQRLAVVMNLPPYESLD